MTKPGGRVSGGQGGPGNDATERSSRRPPRRWRSLLERVLPARDRQDLLHEMDWLYGRRRETDGAAAAARWYRGEVLRFVWHRLIGAVRDTVRRARVDMGDGIRSARRTIRGLARVPGYAAAVILTLGLGIGASALIGGIADRALFRPLPYPEPDQLVSVLDGWAASLGTIELLQREMTTVVALGGAQNAGGMTLQTEGAPARRVTVASVSPEYLEALRVVPALGRVFEADESQPARSRVVLLGDGFWRSHFGATPDVVGRTLVLDGEPCRVVGVLPRGFDLPSARNEIWRPLVMDPSNRGLYWGAGYATLLGRLAPGATPESVRRELLRVQDQVRLANPLWTPKPGFWDEARVAHLEEARSRWARTPLLVLLGAVIVVLLVVCANVTSLFLSRGLARRRDRAVRAALGAGRGRLAREQFLEVALLAAAGLAVGLGLAQLGLAGLRPYLPAELPGAAQAGLDLRIVLATTGMALLAALIAGLAPALRIAGRTPAAFLGDARSGGSMAPSRRRATRFLVAAQLTASVVLVISAGLLARTLIALARVDPGFETDGRVTAQLHLPPGLSTDREARAADLAEIGSSLEGDPALRRVALASTVPFGGVDESVAFYIDGVTEDPNDLPVMPHHRVTGSYFAVAGIPLLRGRTFDASDRPGTPLVAIVDQTFVQRFFGGGPAIGRVIRYPWRGAPDIEIVGVVGAIHHADLASEPEPTVWVPLFQMGMAAPEMAVALAQVAGTPGAGLAAITERMRKLDERIALSDLTAYRDLLGASVAGTRIVALLLAVFAGTTLVLACVGVYGVAAYSVRERYKEIGVRMAIGAPAERIRRGVLQEGLVLTIPGGTLGLLLAIPATRLLEGLLFGVAPMDPFTFGATPALLAVAAVLAVYLPGRRAMRIDPAAVLREE